MERLDMNGGALSLEALEHIIAMVQEYGELEIVNVAKPKEPISLLTWGAAIARKAECERQPHPEETARALRHLRSNFCVCGDEKLRGHPFCHSCHGKLPDELQRKIYFLLKDRFVNHYLRGWELLRKEAEPKPYEGEMMSGIAKATDAVIERHKTA